MAENQVDGGQTEGTTQDANAGASSGTGVQQPSFDAAKLQESLDALNNGFKTLEARVNGLQGTKDKEISGLKGKIAEYEQLKERLGSSESAMEQLELRDQLAQMNAALTKLTGSVSTQTPGTGASGAGELAQVIADNQLDANDPEVTKILADYKGLRAATELGKLAASRASKPPASPAASTSMTGGSTSVVETNVEVLTAEFKQKMQATPRGQAGKAARDALKDEYRKKGVSVFSVDFG